MKDKKEECTILAEEILRNIELSELPFKSVILKGLRLCRLLSDELGTKLFTYEATGYPLNEKGNLTNEAWDLCLISGRRHLEKEEDGTYKEYAFTSTVGEMESLNEIQNERMKVLADPASYGDGFTPYMIEVSKHTNERKNIANSIKDNSKRIEIIKLKIYDYVLKIYNELLYGNLVEDIFRVNRNLVDEKLINYCPETIKKLSSIYDNLASSNEEDWANAIHSCRRILKEVADNLYPPTDKTIKVGKKEIKLGEEQYINRLIQYIDNKSDSKTYKNIVGSSLEDIGNKLDALNDAACKGTHNIVTKFEAQRYLIYTYLFLGDILSLDDSDEECDK